MRSASHLNGQALSLGTCGGMRLACVALLLPLFNSALFEQRTLLYDRRIAPPSWNIASRAPLSQRMHFFIAVKQQNLNALEAQFWETADPKSPRWRKFMSIDEIDGIVASKKLDMQDVKAWLNEGLSHDARSTVFADAIEVQCSVADAEVLFETTIFRYIHDSGQTILRSFGAYSVPTRVHVAIDFVEGIGDFPMPRSSVHKQNGSPIVAMVAPQTLFEMYSVPTNYTISKASQCLVEFSMEASYNKNNLKTFFRETDLPDKTVSKIVGPFNGSLPNIEATLDVQYIMSVGGKHTTWYWTADNWMFSWANSFYNSRRVPDVVSISYGWAEDQQCSFMAPSECQTLGIDSELYVQRVNVEFQKIGLRGVSLFAASGDSGANGRTDANCTGSTLHASFPASSPYITAVGATQLQDPQFDLKDPPPACSALGPGSRCASGGTEVAASAAEAGFTSGGGFSSYSSMPAYQKTAVVSYLVLNEPSLPPKSYFNRSNRAYPDIAAIGSNYLIYANRSILPWQDPKPCWSTVYGTSAATPTVAGISTYLNDLSYRTTGKPLGFLSPLLYQMHAEAPEAFTDVVHGDNKCTEMGCSSRCNGYVAAKGWDPVTGLGTPVTDKMLAYVEKLLKEQETPALII